jgi:PAS domain S-box-containing protein
MTGLSVNCRGSSLKSRIMILTAVCVAFSTLTTGAMSYIRIRSEALELAEIKLAKEARLLSQRFSLDYHLVANDLKTIALTPPVQGLIRTARNNGVDPQDGSTDALWRSRLATIFQAVLRGRPDYFQFRYIGLDDAGRELVRVDRTAQGLTTAAAGDLQQKQREPYFHLGSEAPSGKVVFSEVSYNREHGHQDGKHTATLRGIYPVEGPDGNRFGFLVINVNYESMLRSTFQEINPPQETYVINGSGDFMEHSVGGSQSTHRLELHDALSGSVPDIVRQVQESRQDEGLFFAGDKVAYYVRDAGEYAQTSASLGVIVRIPKSDWHATLTRTRNEFLLAGFLVVLLSTGVAVVAARWMMQPLSDLSKAVRSSSGDDKLDDLPVSRNDEIGELAWVIRTRNAELIERRVRASAIVNNVVDGLILIDAYGCIEEFNPSCERTFGYPAAEVIGKNIEMLLGREDAERHAEFLKRYRDGKGGNLPEFARELEAVDRSGRAFPIELAINAVTVGGETKFSGVLRDISERKEIDRMRNEFVSTVSHELRTPLTSIRGSLTLIDTLARHDLSPKVGKMLAMAQKNTERLILLVNDILDFEKQHAGETRFNFQDLDLNEEIGKAIDLNQGYATEAHVHLTADLGPEMIGVSLDAEKFQQMLGNLISNAVKYSRKNGSVTVRALVAGDRARIEVVDRGGGIPEGFKERIFEPFSQADSSVTRRKGGTGLGLNITKTIAEGMRGTIGFESREDVGTTFRVDFPLRNARPADADLVPKGFTPGRLLGLHLEDDRDFHIVLQSGLDGELDLLHVQTLADARLLLAKHRFDIVILDRLLRDGEGLDLIRSIPDPGQTKIVVVTAWDENVQHIHVDETLIKSKTRPLEFVKRFARIIDEIKAGKTRRSNIA